MKHGMDVESANCNAVLRAEFGFAIISSRVLRNECRVKGAARVTGRSWPEVWGSRWSDPRCRGGCHRMMGRRWKYWDGSIKGHLWNKTSVKLYLFQGIGVFLICILLYPRSRFIGAAALAVGFVAVDRQKVGRLRRARDSRAG